MLHLIFQSATEIGLGTSLIKETFARERSLLEMTQITSVSKVKMNFEERFWRLPNDENLPIFTLRKPHKSENNSNNERLSFYEIHHFNEFFYTIQLFSEILSKKFKIQNFA